MKTLKDFTPAIQKKILEYLKKAFDGIFDGKLYNTFNYKDAVEVDKHIFIHKNGESEEMILYKTKEKFNGEEDLSGNSPAPLAWLKMTCPSTGTKYLIPSDVSFNN